MRDTDGRGEKSSLRLNSIANVCLRLSINIYIDIKWISREWTIMSDERTVRNTYAYVKVRKKGRDNGNEVAMKLA